MYEANFEFPYREPLECDFNISQSELQADLIINAVIGDKHFTFEQAVASVSLVDSAGTQFDARVVYDSLNQCTVYMNGATKGKAYLN